MMKKSKNSMRLTRKRRIRVKGTAKRPRLNVFRSLRVIYASLVDDETGKVLCTVDSRKLKRQQYDKKSAEEVGKMLAKKAKKMKISEVVFDRSGYKYHGKIKALAEGARQAGLKF